MWLLVDKRARKLWSQIVKGGIESIHCFPDIFLALKVGGAKEMREVVVRMTGVECCDQIGKGSATGDLAEGSERTRSG